MPGGGSFLAEGLTRCPGCGRTGTLGPTAETHVGPLPRKPDHQRPHSGVRGLQRATHFKASGQQSRSLFIPPAQSVSGSAPVGPSEAAGRGLAMCVRTPVSQGLPSRARGLTHVWEEGGATTPTAVTQVPPLFPDLDVFVHVEFYKLSKTLQACSYARVPGILWSGNHQQ